MKGRRLIEVPLSKLKPHPKNARKHSPEQLRQIAASIAEFGWGQPILADSDMVIIAGHGRAESQKLKCVDGKWIDKTPAEIAATKAPVIVLEGLSLEQAEALRIADNRIAQNAEWDEELLAAAIRDIESEVDLALLGFDDKELERLCRPAIKYIESLNEEPESEHEPELPPANDEPPKAKETFPLAIVLTVAQHREWRKYKESVGEDSDSAAFLLMMEAVCQATR